MAIAQQDKDGADLPVFDSDFQCIEGSLASRYIKDLKIDLKSFGPIELCDSKYDIKKLFSALQIIEMGRFDQDVGNHKLIRGFVPSEKYYPWLKKQTLGVRRGHDIPYATAYNSGGYFTLEDGWAKLSTLGRVGALIHEARHTQGFPHTECLAGPYMDTHLAACDKDFASGGSHAVEMEYYARVAVLGSNFHPAYKAMARLMASARSNFVFNKSPLQKKETLLGQSPDQRIFLLTEKGWLERSSHGGLGKLKRTSFGASVFDGVRASAIELYESFFTDIPLSDDYSYFKILKDDDLGGVALLDFEEFDQRNKRFVVSLDERGKLSSYNFRVGGWKSKVSGPPKAESFHTLLQNGKKGLFIRTQNGNIYKINPENLKEQSRISEKWPAHFLQFVQWQGQSIGLLDNGALERFSDQPAPFVSVVNVPLYDSFEVKP